MLNLAVSITPPKPGTESARMSPAQFPHSDSVQHGDNDSGSDSSRDNDSGNNNDSNRDSRYHQVWGSPPVNT
jgi:hypothetical protein